MTTGPKEIALSDIRIDGGTQPRSMTDPATVDDYKEAMERGDVFPPVVVFYDGKNHWLADGFHRFIATHERGKKKILAEIRKGTRREAILYAVGANASHGRRRTNLDKRRCVEILLKDKEWTQRGNRWIADACGVGAPLVTQVRRDLKLDANPIRVRRDGKTIDIRKTTGHRDMVQREGEIALAPPPPPTPAPLHAVAGDYELAMDRVHRLDAPQLLRLREEIDGRLRMIGAA